MSKFRYLPLLFIAVMAMFMSCKSHISPTSPATTDTTHTPQDTTHSPKDTVHTTNFGFTVELSGIPVLLKNDGESHDMGTSHSWSDTTAGVIQFSFGIQDSLLKLCDSKAHGDTINMCYDKNFHDPNNYSRTIDTSYTLRYIINSQTKTLGFLSASYGTDDYTQGFAQGGSDHTDHSVRDQFTILNLPYRQSGDTLIAEAQGAAINFQSKSLDQSTNSSSGGFITGSSSNTDVLDIQTPLPDSAHVKITIVVKH